MDSEESPFAHHPSQFLQPPLPPPHSHGTMAVAPPPQLLPNQQEQLSSYILPTNVIFQQPQQQLNLQFPFNSVSDQNPNSSFLDDGSSVAAAGAAAGAVAGAAAGAGAKKKRGRPRKYSTDGNNGSGVSATPIAQIPVNQADSGVGGVNGGASLENSSKKVRGRPPGSGKKKKQEALGAVGFTPYVIPVHIGEDIANKIVNFSLQGPPAVCILAATGVVCNVTLRQSIIGGGTVTYEGRFNIISLSGSFLLSESNGNRSRTGGLSVALSGPDGRVLGGVVAGMLKAASPVQLVVGTFTPEKEKLMSEAPSSTPPPNVLNSGAPVTETSSPSPGGSSDSVDDNGGSPLIHEQGPFGNAAQPMHNAPQPMHGMPAYWGQGM